MLKLRKKDRVMVMGGKDKGKIGEIIKIFPEKMRVLVSKINIVSKHKKGTQSELGGIQKFEAPIAYSKIMLMCPKCEKPSRVGLEKIPGGGSVRVCRHCEQQIE
jgi:large subunit ribosomal protein L24